MIQFKSVLKDEIVWFLALRRASKSKSAYDHDGHTFKLFDEYLCSIDCEDKKLTDEQVTGWIATLTGKSSLSHSHFFGHGFVNIS